MNTPQALEVSPIRIMLVDDSATVRRTYSELLSKNPLYEVRVASNMDEALELAEHFLPDLCIIDYYMPQGNGDVLTRTLLAQPATCKTLVVILTEQSEVEELALAAGAMDVIYKDEPAQTFLHRIAVIQNYINNLRALIFSARQTVEQEQRREQMQRQKQESQLRQQWLESILQSIPDGLCVTDAGGSIERVNPALLEMSGYLQSELIGKGVELLLVNIEGSTGLEDLQVGCADGSILPVSITRTPLEPTHAAHGEYVWVFHDLSELLSAEQAHQSSKAKDEFLASMSHELRTPLTSIIGNAEILAGTTLTEDQQSLLGFMRSSSKGLLALVNDILDISKIEAGKFEIDDAPYDLDVLLEEIERMFIVHGMGLVFEVNRPQPQQHLLLGDAKRIGQILINLLGNAVKFTSQGKVTLSYWVEENMLNFSVRDSGIGMSPEVLQRLFQPFEQADSSISRRFGGTGLGLHISGSLAVLMGGDIHVYSQQEKGSEFILKLPYRESDVQVEANSAQQSDDSLSDLNQSFMGEVLLVEDTLELQLLQSRILRTMGATVTIANNGEEALEKTLQQHFDLIFMDMQMPVMDGLEGTKTLRSVGNETPIVGLTANVMQRHREQFFDAGADGFLQKPIDTVKLRGVLKKYLKSNPRKQQGSSTQPDAESPPVVTQSDTPPYPILVIDDEQSVLELYQSAFGGDVGEADETVEILEGLIEGRPINKAEKEFTVTIADQGKTGVQFARQAFQQGLPFPVAFIDMRMPPGMDGLETAKALREVDQQISIVIVTAYLDVDPKKIHQELGRGVFYMNKPFGVQEVQQIARMFIRGWGKGPQTADQEEKKPEQPHVAQTATTPVVDPMIDDELMELFYERIAEHSKVIRAALAQEDWAELRMAVHTIKGSAATFGFFEIGEIAKEMQQQITNGELEQLPDLAMRLVGEIDKILLD
ncbi:MAG: response regulator [Gammaproteobacteria bacterium]|jgi:CheY-like chemotaxis protein/anti-sigma regulatory factor (Ser/Thr protein kinase)|nr:response regulator [Gammaproteobacteria bacterium]MBT4606088.1 response regulator [Thiotrichales bacterium]MBT5745576.1 response regulator [Gammaproteobacteria bacterium]MBT6079243.1 response regulator [Gammaproteobacteria bacterium]MBT8007610.1 response regulator [Gammaproteobacteria bacterium]